MSFSLPYLLDLAGTFVFALSGSRLWASPGPDQQHPDRQDPDPQHIEAVKKKVARCVDRHRRVAVETFDGRRLQGAISEARSDDFLLVYGGRAWRLPQGSRPPFLVWSSCWEDSKADTPVVISASGSVADKLYSSTLVLAGD